MNINRLDIIILQLLKSNECNNKFSGMTISEMLESCNMVLVGRHGFVKYEN